MVALFYVSEHTFRLSLVHGPLVADNRRETPINLAPRHTQNLAYNAFSAHFWSAAIDGSRLTLHISNRKSMKRGRKYHPIVLDDHCVLWYNGAMRGVTVSMSAFLASTIAIVRV